MDQVSQINKSSVLVIDDNPLITNVISSLLLSQDYRVTCCKNGEEGLEKLESESPFDLIICDVMMPKLDGYGFHQKLREKSEFNHIPFIFLTALEEKDEIYKGKEIGVDDYVVKPFEPRELLATVKGKIGRAKQIIESAEEKSENYRKKVIHTLSHEFRTPLVAINTGTELLLDQGDKLDPARALTLLNAIKRGGERLEKLVNDFMLMQQIEAGVAGRLFEERATKNYIHEVVRAAIEAKEEELVADGFKVHFNSYANKAQVHIYSPHIQDSISRFIENARKFSGDIKRIDITVSAADGQVFVEVLDRGIGIDVRKVQQAINAFGQVDREQFEQQGGGLSLALVSKYAAIHNGELLLSKREGGGTSVKLILPECL